MSMKANGDLAAAAIKAADNFRVLDMEAAGRQRAPLAALLGLPLPPSQAGEPPAVVARAPAPAGKRRG